MRNSVQVSDPVSSVDNALRLLQFLGAQEQVRVADAAEHLGVARSTAYRLLSTLKARGFADQERANTAYRPGPALAALCWSVIAKSSGQSVTALRRESVDVLGRLRDITGETASLVLLEGRTARFVECAEGTANVRVGDRVGLTIDAHTSSVGKALLAALPESNLEHRYPSQQLPIRTSRSISSWQSLVRELDTIRLRGFAINAEESTDDVCAIGIGVGEPPLCPYAGIALAVPASRGDEPYLLSLLPALSEAREALRERLHALR